ncbi:TetR/AcrR family transcriptional regulator [Saccharomonospora halophila]|uniref:TetR/AcrR family transcriptional regulator n=1 Tax=Saccharomonospora halophila TaxID=129922 RepID=UPI00037DEEE2|nr:TetR family transcriptional regulator [Saccharomonospora halophila]
MVTGTSQGKRRWRGREAADRAATRRAQLLEAGTELMGTGGAAGLSMRGVCRQAGLTERYFYESFDNLDSFAVAVLESVVFGARDTLLAALETAPRTRAELIRHAVRAFTDHVVADPRRGRIMLGESMTSPALSRRGWELVDEFTAPIGLVMTTSGPGDADGADGVDGTDELGGMDDADIRRNALAVFGALAALYQRWIGDGFPGPRERFEEHVAGIIEQITAARSR